MQISALPSDRPIASSPEECFFDVTICNGFDASAANLQNEHLFNIYTESEREEEQGVCSHCSAIPTLYGDSLRSAFSPQGMAKILFLLLLITSA